MSDKGFLNFIVVGIIVVGMMMSGLGYFIFEKNSFSEPTNNTVSSEKDEKPFVYEIVTKQEIHEPPRKTTTGTGALIGKKEPVRPTSSSSLVQKQNIVPTVEPTRGYTFAIIGAIHDTTDAPAMTSGKPMAGIVVRAAGPTPVTTQTRSDGSYTLSFTNAPVGTYDLCVTIPSGYRANPPSGCEVVTVRLSEIYDKTLELINNGHAALHGTVINFNILRESTADQAVSSESSEVPPVNLKGIGIHLDYYDPNTGRAGDFVFTKEKLHFDRLFMPYGFFIPSSSASPDKYNPQPTFILPLGTPVRSLVDGKVANIATVWSGDYSIQVTMNGKMEKWIYETEHVIHPRVKVGDEVRAGQIIAEVSDFDRGAPVGFGTVEIGILKGGNPPQHVCPFAYLDVSIRDDVQKKLAALYKAWEEFKSDQSLYDENALVVPGCLTLNSIDG